MTTIKKLEKMPYAQAHVEIDDEGNVCLFSYITLVAAIKNEWLEIYGLYSMTTRKHISAFVREYTCLDYSTAKEMYENNCRISILTGEVEEMEN